MKTLLILAILLTTTITPRTTHAQSQPNQEPQTQSAPDQSAPDQSATDQCGYDRRCRIDRLKRLGQQKRRKAILQEEHEVSQIAADLHQEHLSNNPRINKPWGADFAFNSLGPGLALGYNFTGWLRLESTIIFHDDWIYAYEDDGTYIDGQQNAYFLNLAATYFPMTGWFSPFLNLGITAGWGDFSSGGFDYFYDWNNPSEGLTPNADRYAQLHTKYHIVTAAAGLDFQFAIGLHARFGFEYGYLLYNQARYSAGNYDAEIRKGLNTWMSETALWGFQFHLGWAF